MSSCYNLIPCSENCEEILYVSSELLDPHIGDFVIINGNEDCKYRVSPTKSFVASATETCILPDSGGCAHMVLGIDPVLPVGLEVISIIYNGTEYISTPQTINITPANVTFLLCNQGNCVSESDPNLANNYLNLAEDLNTLFTSLNIPIRTSPYNHFLTDIAFFLPKFSDFQLKIRRVSGPLSGSNSVYTYSITPEDDVDYGYAGGASTFYATLIDECLPHNFPIESVNQTECEECQECEHITYELVDCEGRVPTFKSRQEDLGNIVGKYIKIPFHQNSCFLVQEGVCLHKDTRYEVEYVGVYETCTDCYQRKTIAPKEKIAECECSYESFCNSNEDMYRKYKSEIIHRKTGIVGCCGSTTVNEEIRYNLDRLEVLNHCSPPLPEPEVNICCLELKKSCTPCNKPVDKDDSECPCICVASENSPHDCHKYHVEVSEEQLEIAAGNDNINLNGKLFFVYFPCGETHTRTLQYSNETAEDICVLGIPKFGYYSNNVWVEIDIIREEICEKEKDNCDGKTKCK